MPGSKMIYLNNNYFIITRNHFQDFSKKRFSEQLCYNNKTFYKTTKIEPTF